MSKHRLALGALALPLLVACADRNEPTGLTPQAFLSSSSGGGNTKQIKLRDDCDSASFNAVLGAGSCVRRGSVDFDEFIAELTKKRIAGAWKNNPDQFGARVGIRLDVSNIGGEAHTFTHVARFGGGIVPLLNQLSGNPTVAPECNQLAPTDFVPAGGQFSIPTGGGGLAVGTHRFQCCIHPWMRTTATLKRN